MSPSPTIAYPGGKARLAQEIISFLPKHGRTYIEPFTGRGNLFWAAASAALKYEKWWLNDISTIPFFRAVNQIGHVVDVPEHSRAEYERQREASKRGDPVAALLEPLLTFGGGGYCFSGFRGTHRGGVSSPAYQKTLRECHRIMNETKPRLSALDWQDMKLKDLGPEDTVVLDPPYPSTDVRSYSEATVDYDRLVDTLLRAKFRWLLCGYVHPALHRLGNPFWAKEVRFIYFTDREKQKYGEERRIECLWKYDPPHDTTKYALPSILRPRLKIQNSAASLSFPDLDAKIDVGLQEVAKDFSALVPYLLEMNRRLSAPGRRSDLRKGAPAGLSWTQWVESKQHKLGRSLRTIQYMLKGQTEASKDRQMLLAQRHASLRSEPDSTIPSTSMEIAAEMARLVLEMRGNGRNAGAKKQRLELLAEHFLRITGNGSQSDSIDSIEIGNRTPGVTLTM